jgi:hypothetical protein
VLLSACSFLKAEGVFYRHQQLVESHSHTFVYTIAIILQVSLPTTNSRISSCLRWLPNMSNELRGSLANGGSRHLLAALASRGITIHIVVIFAIVNTDGFFSLLQLHIIIYNVVIFAIVNTDGFFSLLQLYIINYIVVIFAIITTDDD